MTRESLFEKLDEIQDQIGELESALDSVKDLIRKITLKEGDDCYHRSHDKKKFEYTTIGGADMLLVKCGGCGTILHNEKKVA